MQQGPNEEGPAGPGLPVAERSSASGRDPSGVEGVSQEGSAALLGPSEYASPVARAPASGSGSSPTKSLQPRFLKQINQLSSKEDLLAHVEACHHLLDAINLVTILYRLARIYSFTQATRQKIIWKAELLDSPQFAVLLDVIRTHLLQAQAALANQARSEAPGINARCLSNLVWSIVKLEMTSEHSHPAALLAVDVAVTAAPLVLHCINECSGQGLSNLLWSYAKIQNAPPAVMIAIVARMVELLETPESATLLDAQALSNSIWAIAHVRSRPNDLDGNQEWQHVVTNFLLLVTNQCLTVLSGQETGTPPTATSSTHALDAPLQGGDGRFSCQAVVNIAWSFSTILGSACGAQEPVRPLFLLIRKLSIQRLQAILSGNINSPMHNSPLTGSFNEQALSNLVYAFDRAQLLSGELLQAVFDMAAVRLSRPSTGSQGPLGFKPQELCTLLRACNLGIAQPWAFLTSLSRLLSQFPTSTAAWTPAEMLDLQRALQLLRSMPPAYAAAAQPQPQQRLTPVRPAVGPSLSAPQQIYLPAQTTAMAAAPVGMAAAPAGYNYAATSQLLMGNVAATRPQMLYRQESAPESRMMGVLREQSFQQGFHEGGLYGRDSFIVANSISASGVPQAPNQMASLQQVWVVDQAGNLQPTTIVVQHNPQMSAQDPYGGYSLH